MSKSKDTKKRGEEGTDQNPERKEARKEREKGEITDHK